jgi:hypothetical protein
MAALTMTTDQADVAGDVGLDGPPRARTAGPVAADRSSEISGTDQAVRSWPLLVLAAPAAAEVWSGWVGIAHKTGFGLVSPLPGIWPSLHLDTAITLPIGVEAYAAYALRAWLARDRAISTRTRRLAKWSAVCSFALGMAGQVAYHLMAQAGMARAPWAVTTVVSCLPVLVLGMGTALAHMLRADTEALDAPDNGAGPPAMPRPATRSPEDQDRSLSGDQAGEIRGQRRGRGSVRADLRVAGPQVNQARIVGRRLAAAGKPVSRRALRSSGVRGSNEALNALARMISGEIAGTAQPRAPVG